MINRNRINDRINEFHRAVNALTLTVGVEEIDWAEANDEDVVASRVIALREDIKDLEKHFEYKGKGV